MILSKTFAFREGQKLTKLVRAIQGCELRLNPELYKFIVEDINIGLKLRAFSYTPDFLE